MLSNDRLSNYPLRQSLLPGARNLRIFETRGVVDWLSRPERFLVACEGRGGRIYAADERCLEQAQQVIANAHGTKVVFREPEVHTYTDPERDALVEPVMFLRIKVPHAYAREVLAELSSRRVRILEQDMQSYDLVIRAEAPLVNLLGLTRMLELFGQSSIAFWTWLDRYERAMTATIPADSLRSHSRAAPGPTRSRSTHSVPPEG